MVYGFRCSMECYGECDHCRGLIQKVGDFEDLMFFRRAMRL